MCSLSVGKLSNVASGAVNAVKEGASKAQQAAAPLLQDTVSVAGKVKTSAKTGFSKVLPFLNNMASKVGKFFKNGFSATKTLLVKSKDAIVALLKKVGSMLKSLVKVAKK